MSSPVLLLSAGSGLIAATYGLVRMAYGLFLPDVQAELGLDVAAAGAVSSGASVVYSVGALLGFLVGARHPRALVIAAALSASVGALGMALAPSAAVFAAFAIASSAGAGLASPALVAVLQRNASTAEHPRAQAIVNAGTGPGVIVAGMLAIALLPAWRAAWVIAAVFTAVVAVVVALADRNDAETSAAPRAVPPLAWWRSHLPVIIAALLMGCGSAAVWTYGRVFLVGEGTTPLVSMLAWIALGVGGTAVIVTSRWMEPLAARTAWTVTVGAVAVATASVVVAPAGDLLALAAFALFGWGYTAGSGVLITWTATIDAARAPAGTAMLFVTLILGQAVGASVTGTLVPAAGYPVAFLVAALVAAAAVVPAWSRTAR